MTDSYTISAAYYDLAPVYQERRDKDFYLAQARQVSGPVLELGCGTGRILLPIAQAGIDITGLDASSAMLDICRSRLEAEGLSVPLALGDMRSFDLGRKFALITIPFRPFQHLLDPPDQIACLQTVRRHLAPTGRLILDVFDLRMDLLIQDDGAEHVEFDFTHAGRAMQRSVRRVTHDRPRQVLEMELIYLDKAGGERSTAPLTMRYFFRYEMEHLLARCGFRVLDVLGDFDGSPVGTAARELIFIAACSP
jgi:SAM-dependent methyltransferase